MIDRLRVLTLFAFSGFVLCLRAGNPIPETAVPTVIVITKAEPIANITLLGSDEKAEWTQTAEALTVKAPTKSPNNIAIMFKLTL